MQSQGREQLGSVTIKGIETSPKQTASTLLSSTSVLHSLCLLLSNEAITTLSHTALVLEENYNGV